MSGFYNDEERGRPVKIKDEGITLVDNVSSLDFVGAGVTGSTLGNDVTETIAGASSSTVLGPASATDLAIARYDGTTGKLIKNSSTWLITDNGIMYSGGFRNDANLPIQIAGAAAQYGVCRTTGNYGLMFGVYDTSTYAMRVVSATDSFGIIVNNTVRAMTVTTTGTIAMGGAVTSSCKLFVGGTTDVSLVDAAVPIQISAASGVEQSIGINKAGAYGILFGYRNNIGGVTAAVLRVIPADNFEIWVNNTSRAFAVSSSSMVGINQVIPTSTLHIVPFITSSGTARAFAVDGVSHTAQTASTEIINFAVNTYTRQWATGAITTQRENVFFAPTYAAVGASTFTTVGTLVVSAAPIAGTNVTLTNPLAFWVQAGKTALVGDTYIGTLTTSVNAKLIVRGDGGDIFSCDNAAGGRMFSLAESGTITLATNLRINGAQIYNGSAGDGIMYCLTADTSWVFLANATDRKGLVVAGPATGTMARNYFEVRLRWNATGNELMVIDSLGNMNLGVATAGATAQKVLTISNTATAPTTSVDRVQIYSADVSAGNAVLAFFQEMAPYAGAAVVSTTKIPMIVNGVTYYVLATTVA